MAPLRRLVIDVLKHHEPTTLAFTQQVADAASVDSVNATIIELDKDVLNLRLTIEGDAIESDAIETIIEDAGGTIHSVDQVVCGEDLIEDTPTPQD